MLASKCKAKPSWLIGFFLVLPLVAGSQVAAPLHAKEHAKDQNVLLLLAGNAGRPSVGRIAQSAQEEMMVKGGSEIHLQLASTDPIAESSPRLSEIEKDWFRTRYAGVHFNLIVTTDGSPL